MKIIFGLGNPGLKYEWTRHNTGFLVVDAILKRNRKMKKIKKSYAELYKDEEKDVFYIKPLLYMNLSGVAVKRFLIEFGLLGQNFTLHKSQGENSQDKDSVEERFSISNDGFKFSESIEKIDRFLVVCDDYNLPFGQLRFRRKGSSGGHNGIESIIQELGTSDFHRLRIGIGEPTDDGDTINYVLSPFKPNEIINLNEVINNAVEAIFTYIEKGIDKAMNNYNRDTLL